MTNLYTASTPEVDVTTSTTPNVANAEPIAQISDDERIAFARYQAAMVANPDIAAKIEKILDKSETEGASAVRGNVVNAIETAVNAAVSAMVDSESESFIDGSREYMVRVGKITTTAEIAPDGTLVVSTKSPRRKRDGSESTATA